MTDRDKIVDKIKKLLAKANGTENEAEAAVFAQKAHELLMKHDVDATEVSEQETVDEPIQGMAVKTRYNTQGFRWMATALSQYYMCGRGVVVRKFGKKVYYDFLGRESRITVACQMYTYLENTIYRMSRERYPMYHQRFEKRNFEKGAAVSMSRRILAMKAKAVADNPDNLPALYNEAFAQYDDYVKGMKTIRNVPVKADKGYSEGYRAANNISMSEQLNASSTAPKNILLTSQ